MFFGDVHFFFYIFFVQPRRKQQVRRSIEAKWQAAVKPQFLSGPIVGNKRTCSRKSSSSRRLRSSPVRMASSLATTRAASARCSSCLQPPHQQVWSALATLAQSSNKWPQHSFVDTAYLLLLFQFFSPCCITERFVFQLCRSGCFHLLSNPLLFFQPPEPTKFFGLAAVDRSA